MNKKIRTPNNFKININKDSEDEIDDEYDNSNDASPDSLFKKELDQIRLDKLNQRINIIAILLPCLVCAIIFVAYLDVNEKLDVIQNTSIFEVQKLSKQLETQVSSLSSKYLKLEEAFGKKVSDTENTSVSFKENINKIESTIQSIQAVKIERKELSDSISGLENKFTAFYDEIKNYSAIIKITNEQMTQIKSVLSKNTELIEQYKAQLSMIQTELNDISSVSSAKIGKKELEAALDNNKKYLQQELNKLLENLSQLSSEMKSKEEKISAIEIKIKDIIKSIKASEKVSEKTSERVSPPIPTTTIKKTYPKNIDGKIIEDDIKD